MAHHAAGADRLSQRLTDAANDLQGERVAVAALADAHGPAAAGTALVLVSAACLVPLPGVGTVLGIGLAAMAWALWRQPLGSGGGLPAAVAGFEMPRAMAQRVLRLLARCHGLAERLARQRLPGLVPAQGLNGWLASKTALMAGIIVLPLPLGNVLPALALVLLGLALVYRDGLAVLLSLAAAGLAVAYSAALGLAAWQAGTVWLPRLWG